MRPIQWQLQSVDVTPNQLQKVIYKQYAEATELIGEHRKNKRLIPVFVGDATEGIHHGSMQHVTARTSEHEMIAADAIDNGLQLMGFGEKHDRFYMVAGTESHVGESEERIAKDIEGIIPYQKAPIEDKVTRWCWPLLPIKVNGVLGLVAHHGPGGGNGANEGNPLRNRLKNIVFSRLARGKEIPRFIVFGHRHTKQHVQFELEDILVDGFILPSFQGKTDWFYSIDAMAFTNIGMLQMDINTNGELSWEWLTMEITDHQEKVEIV